MQKIIYGHTKKKYTNNGSKISTKVPFSNSVDFYDRSRSSPLGSAVKTSGKIEISDLCNASNCNYRIDFVQSKPKW